MRINEVSKSLNISIDTLRYYEKFGLIDEVRKENGIRVYTDKEIERIKFIQCMKQTGMSIETMRTYFALVKEGDQSLEKRLALLETQSQIAQAKMEELKSSLDYVQYKIGWTKENILKRDHKSKL